MTGLLVLVLITALAAYSGFWLLVLLNTLVTLPILIAWLLVGLHARRARR